MHFQGKLEIGDLASETQVAFITSERGGPNILKYAIVGPDAAKICFNSCAQHMHYISQYIKAKTGFKILRIEIFDETFSNSFSSANIRKRVHHSCSSPDFKHDRALVIFITGIIRALCFDTVG